MLEDKLAAGNKFKVISLSDEKSINEKNSNNQDDKTDQQINDEFSIAAIDKQKVCSLLGALEMNKRLVNLYRKSRLDMSEGGANTLFLAIGFLSWKKRLQDTRSYQAPLLLLPIKLTRRSAQSPFYLEHHEDEVRVNTTLLQLLSKDFSLTISGFEGELPRDESGIDTARIFSIFRQEVEGLKGFEVVEQIALSTFNFSKYLMWKDLVDRTDSLTNNRLVKHLIETPEENNRAAASLFPKAKDIDLNYSPGDLFTPLPADSSQLTAVLAAEQDHDFVIIGPPGTGKSQTIANIIAHCLSKNKSILFVAEKTAALDVVYRRLKAIGLGNLCLELHSNKSERKKVITQLGQAWERQAQDSHQQWMTLASNLKMRRDELNNYVAELHQPGSHGYSLYHAIGFLASQSQTAITLVFDSIDQHNSDDFKSLESIANQATNIYPLIKKLPSLSIVNKTSWSLSWSEKLIASTIELQDATQQLIAITTELRATWGLKPDPECDRTKAETLKELSELVVSIKNSDLNIALQADFQQFNVALDSFEQDLNYYQQAQNQLSACYRDNDITTMPLIDMDNQQRRNVSKIWPLSTYARWQLRKRLQSYCVEGEANPQNDIALLQQLASLITNIESSILNSIPCYNGVDTDIQQLKQFMHEATALNEIFNYIKQSVADSEQFLHCCDDIFSADNQQTQIITQSQHYLKATEQYEQALQSFQNEADHGEVAPHLQGLTQQLDNLIQAKSQLQDWVAWVAIVRQAEQYGLSNIIEAIENEKSEDALHTFYYAYFQWWVPLAVDQTQTIRQFTYWGHEKSIDDFCKLDEQVNQIASHQIQQSVSNNLPAKESVSRKSELGVLRHQLGLQRPSIPIRELIAALGDSFHQLVPCVLMSPLSVAQYLPADHQTFDMVIIDEASQITTWDAVGTIARGKQSIIVGDPKQLPPTTFFARSNGNEDEAVELHERDLPSILDEASAAGLPNHQLNWHYRSRDELLIAFSNAHYYDNRLITFPSPQTGANAIHHHRVKGIYQRGSTRINQQEADYTTNITVNYLEQWLDIKPNERPSLGIITFNVQQKDILLDCLDEVRKQKPEYEWFFDEEREEPLIVKNLENIQGDERDIILFVTTFGVDDNGKLSMVFGAINKDGGEKRLNVAITRARSELHVITSLDSDQIDLTRTQSLGVKHFKQFLYYAEHGAATLIPVTRPSKTSETAPAVNSKLSAESNFEAAIVKALESLGWIVTLQLGVSDFRIDIAVVHPQNSEQYLAAIECDGKYYAAANNARDRDKIRRQVLTRLGWSVIRVWSIDWLIRPEDSIQRLHAKLSLIYKTSTNNYKLTRASGS